MNTLRIAETLCAVFLFVLLFSKPPYARAASPAAGHFYYELVDLSGSTASPIEEGTLGKPMRVEYRNWSFEVLRQIKPGDRYAIAPITTDSGYAFNELFDRSFQTVATSPLGANFWEGEPDDNEGVFLDQLRSAADTVKNVLAKPIATNRSCIINAINQVAPYLATWHGPKSLLVFSDMLQSCGGGNFERRPPGKDLVRTLERQHRIPSLLGVHVWVAGAWAPSGFDCRAIEDFWLSFFRRAGAVISDETYGHQLRNFK